MKVLFQEVERSTLSFPTVKVVDVEGDFDFEMAKKILVDVGYVSADTLKQLVDYFAAVWFIKTTDQVIYMVGEDTDLIFTKLD